MPNSRSLPRLSHHLQEPLHQRLWLQVLIGMTLGIAFGIVIGPAAGLVDPAISTLIGNWVALPGRLFLLAIQFVVVPLVVASVIRGIAAGEAGGNLGKVGLRTVMFFVATTVGAVAVGLACAYAINPGGFVDRASMAALTAEGSLPAAASGAAATAPPVAEIPELIAGLFPRDPLTTFVSGNMLQIVIAAAIIGVALANMPATERRPLLDLLASVQAVAMVIVKYVLRFAPLAVFGLLANISARVGLSALIGAGMYVVTTVLGLLILCGIYLAIARVVAGQRPLAFLRASREALLLAFSTSSSAAVMPLTLTTAETALHVRPQIARFVVPLGATINMGGTALYQGVATVFLAQVFGVEMGLAALLLVVVMATGAAIGSPGTPGVGIVILATILTSVGIPAAGIAIILGVDRLLDMCRTAVNVLGDLVACAVIERLTPAEMPAAAPIVITPGSGA